MRYMYTSFAQQYSNLFKQVYCSRKQCKRSAAVLNLSYKVLSESPASSDAPTILLCHGLLSNKRLWKGLGKIILKTTKRPVVIVDLRNHGRSQHTASHKYKELAKDLLRLLERLSIDMANLIGHSMGGRACMCVSLMAPEKIAGLLVVDISPVSSTRQMTDFFPKVMETMKEVDFQGTNKVNAARKAAKKQLKNLVTEDVILKAILSNINIKADGKVGWICNLDVLIKCFKHIASFPGSMRGKKYLGPTLFVGGQLSEYIPADDLPGIRVMFPQAVITYVAGAGHNLHTDDPKSFLEFVIAFIKKND